MVGQVLEFKEGKRETFGKMASPNIVPDDLLPSLLAYEAATAPHRDAAPLSANM